MSMFGYISALSAIALATAEYISVKPMSEPIDESVSVDLLSNHLKRSAYPWIIHWRGNRYMMTKVGLHHTLRDGRILYHVFSVTDGNTFFKLRFNTETLAWKLMEIDS